MKSCKRCFEVKELDLFYSSPRARDGHDGTCKQCRKEIKQLGVMQPRTVLMLKNRELALKGLKICTKCMQTLMFDDFNGFASKAKKISNVCIKCEKAKYKEYFDANKTYVIAKNKEWDNANKARRSVTRRAHYEANKEKNNQNNRQWKADNKDKVTAYATARRVKINGGVVNLPSNYRTILFGYYQQCDKCLDQNNLTHDHVIPASKHGSHTWENSQVLCHSCNISKLNLHATDYRDYQKGVIVSLDPDDNPVLAYGPNTKLVNSLVS